MQSVWFDLWSHLNHTNLLKLEETLSNLAQPVMTGKLKSVHVRATGHVHKLQVQPMTHSQRIFLVSLLVQWPAAQSCRCKLKLPGINTNAMWMWKRKKDRLFNKDLKNKWHKFEQENSRMCDTTYRLFSTCILETQTLIFTAWMKKKLVSLHHCMQ